MLLADLVERHVARTENCRRGPMCMQDRLLVPEFINSDLALRRHSFSDPRTLLFTQCILADLRVG